jgi:hypothetical protein
MRAERRRFAARFAGCCYYYYYYYCGRAGAHRVVRGRPPISGCVGWFQLPVHCGLT